MRKFIKLVETITDSWESNAEIERGLAGLSQEERTVALDGMELLYDAGAAGMTVDAWMGQMKQLWNSDEEHLRNIWQLLSHSFPQFIQKIGNGHYVFHQTVENHAPIDTTSDVAQLAKAQIALTGRILEICRSLGRFTAHDVLNVIAAETEYPAALLREIVEHVIGSNAGTIKSEGQGMYRYDRPMAKSGMNFWRDLEGYEPPKDA